MKRCPNILATGRCMMNAGTDHECYNGEITDAVIAAVNARGVPASWAKVPTADDLATVRRQYRSNEVIF